MRDYERFSSPSLRTFIKHLEIAIYFPSNCTIRNISLSNKLGKYKLLNLKYLWTISISLLYCTCQLSVTKFFTTMYWWMCISIGVACFYRIFFWIPNRYLLYYAEFIILCLIVAGSPYLSLNRDPCRDVTLVTTIHTHQLGQHFGNRIQFTWHSACSILSNPVEIKHLH